MAASFFLTCCEYLSKGSGAIAAGAGAVEGASKVISFVKGIVTEECFLCGAKVKGKDLREHVLTHSVERCFLCDEEVGRLELRAHVLSHRFVKCWECNAEVLIEDLRSHFRAHEVCPICYETVPSSAMHEHTLRHRELRDRRYMPTIRCPTCMADVPGSDYPEHRQTHQGGSRSRRASSSSSASYVVDLDKKNQ